MLAFLLTLACDQQPSDKDSTVPYAEADKDQDGYLEGEDCNDNDANIHPNATEICDDLDIDENCNELADSADSSVQGTETWYPDDDRDGYGDDSAPVVACELLSGTTTSGDCDDHNAARNPGVHEVCDANQMDEDCDGLINDADDNVTEQQSFFRDSDGDGFGDPAQSQLACSAPNGFVNIAQDCDDTDINLCPTQEEISCDGIDQNCDGSDSCTGPANGFFEVDLSQAHMVEPAAMASLLTSYLSVIGVGVEQSNPFLIMTSETLTNNQPSCDMPPLVADFSQDPDFAIPATDVDLNGMIMWSLTASGTFDSNYNGFSQGRITGYVDMRSAIMGEFGTTPDELCSLLTGYGGSCITCPGNGANYCVYLELDQVSGVRVDNASITTGSLCNDQSSFCATVDANTTFALIGLSGLVILKRRRR